MMNSANRVIFFTNSLLTHKLNRSLQESFSNLPTNSYVFMGKFLRTSLKYNTNITDPYKDIFKCIHEYSFAFYGQFLKNNAVNIY